MLSIFRRYWNNKLGDSKLIVPVPPSKTRPKQPVTEIARAISEITNIPINEALLTKCMNTAQMKDVSSPAEKVIALEAALMVNSSRVCDGGPILLVDDLFDTGSSLNACANKIRASIPNVKIYALTVTRKHQ